MTCRSKAVALMLPIVIAASADAVAQPYGGYYYPGPPG